jgi:hypothetical protein
VNEQYAVRCENKCLLINRDYSDGGWYIWDGLSGIGHGRIQTDTLREAMAVADNLARMYRRVHLDKNRYTGEYQPSGASGFKPIWARGDDSIVTPHVLKLTLLAGNHSDIYAATITVCVCDKVVFDFRSDSVMRSLDVARHWADDNGHWIVYEVTEGV